MTNGSLDYSANCDFPHPPSWSHQSSEGFWLSIRTEWTEPIEADWKMAAKARVLNLENNRRTRFCRGSGFISNVEKRTVNWCKYINSMLLRPIFLRPSIKANGNLSGVANQTSRTHKLWFFHGGPAWKAKRRRDRWCFRVMFRRRQWNSIGRRGINIVGMRNNVELLCLEFDRFSTLSIMRSRWIHLFIVYLWY